MVSGAKTFLKKIKINYLKTKTMKHLFICILLFLFNGIVYSQTKEETLEWLKEKFKANLLIANPYDYLESDQLSLSLNTNCELVLFFKTKYVDDRKTHKKGDYYDERSLIFPLADFKIERETNIPNNKLEGEIVYSYKAISIISTGSSMYKTTKSIWISEVGSANSYIKMLNNGVYYDKTGCYFLNGEKDIYNRIEKAVAHLGTLCQKKKETF